MSPTTPFLYSVVSMRGGYDISFTMGLHILKLLLIVSEDLVFIQPSVVSWVRRFGPLSYSKGSGSVSRPGLPGDLRFSVGYCGVHICRTTGSGRLNRRVPLPRCHGRRGPGPSLPVRSPYDGGPAKRSADGRAAEPLHDVSLSSGWTDASELPLSPDFGNGFCGVCRKRLSQC